MEFMKYSNEHQVNIIPKDGYEELVHDVFNIIASNMAKSLGPLGSSSMIIDGMSTEATKDGFAILKNIRFHNLRIIFFRRMRNIRVHLNPSIVSLVNLPKHGMSALLKSLKELRRVQHSLNLEIQIPFIELHTLHPMGMPK